MHLHHQKAQLPPCTIADGVPHVQVTSAESSVLKNGQEIAIAGTNAYDGHYTITKIDEVQIFDTTSYDGNYPITKVDDQNFIINNLR